MISIFSSSLASFSPFTHFVRSTRELRSVISRLASFTFVSLTSFAPLVNSARSSLAMMKSKLGSEREKVCAKHPGTPGTDITHKSVFHFYRRCNIEHDIVSDMGARNAGVCFLYTSLREMTERSSRVERTK